MEGGILVWYAFNFNLKTIELISMGIQVPEFPLQQPKTRAIRVIRAKKTLRPSRQVLINEGNHAET